MEKRTTTIIGVLIWGLLLIAGYASSAGLAPEEFYRGRSIDFTIPSAPGGTVDTFGRVMAEMFNRYLGSTSLITNRRAAGGLEGYVHIYRGKPDGSVIGSGLSLVIAFNQIFRSPGADYDMHKYSYIISAPPEGHVLVVGKNSPYQSIADLKAGKKLVLGSGSPSSNMTISACTLIDVLGLDGKVVTAYPGEPKRRLAIAQGELTGEVGPVASERRGVEQGMAKALCVLGTKRLKEWPELPALTELVPLEGEKRKLVAMWDKEIQQLYMIIGSPGIPKDTVKYIRKTCMDKILKDPQFPELVHRSLERKFPVEDMVTGEEIEETMQRLFDQQDSLRKMFERLIEKYRA